MPKQEKEKKEEENNSKEKIIIKEKPSDKKIIEEIKSSEKEVKIKDDAIIPRLINFAKSATLEERDLFQPSNLEHEVASTIIENSKNQEEEKPINYNTKKEEQKLYSENLKTEYDEGVNFKEIQTLKEKNMGAINPLEKTFSNAPKQNFEEMKTPDLEYNPAERFDENKMKEKDPTRWYEAS